MQSDLLSRYVAQRVVQCIDPQRGVFAILRDRDLGQASPAVRQVGIVDLQQETRIDNRVVFLAHRLGDREQERLVAVVIFVPHPMLDRARRVRRQKGFCHGHSGESGLEIVEVTREFGLADIAQLVDADWHRLAAGVARARMRREIFGKFHLVSRGHAEPPEPAARPIFTAGDPRRDVIGKVRL